MVFSLIYSSTSDHDWSADELLAVLRWSRDWNPRHGITGLLLYRDCTFMQLLEGEEQAVRELFASIASDRRHQDVNLMWTTETARRQFADWSMAFRELGAAHLSVPGYSTVLNEQGDDGGPHHVNVVVDLLSMFRAGVADEPGPA